MRSRAEITGWATLGCVSLAITGMYVVMIPAAGVGLITGLLGMRQLPSDLAAASVRLGISLVAAGIVAVGSIVTGQPVFILPALVALVAFALSWRCCEHLRESERTAWGIEQRDRLHRLHELTQRQDHLRNGPRDRD